MMLDNGGKSCKELEVRINGLLFPGLAGLYDLQSYIYNEKSAYATRKNQDITVNPNRSDYLNQYQISHKLKPDFNLIILIDQGWKPLGLPRTLLLQ